MKSKILQNTASVTIFAVLIAGIFVALPQLVLASAAEDNANAANGLDNDGNLGGSNTGGACCGGGGIGGGGGLSGGGNLGIIDQNNRTITYGTLSPVANGNIPVATGLATFGVVGSFETSFGDEGNNGLGGGGDVGTCDLPPRLFNEDIFFERTDGLVVQDTTGGGVFAQLSGATQVAQVGNGFGGFGGAAPTYGVDQNDMEIGVEYTPKVLVTNRGCQPTNQGTTTVTTRASRFHFPTTTEYPPVYVNDPPAGENGSFPVALRIDFNQDGTYEYNEVVNSAGPLPARDGGFVVFPPITLTEAGTHTVEATVDVRSADSRYGGVGCSGSDACILERDGLAADKDRSETFAAIAPSVEIGSFKSYVHPSGIRINPYDVRTTDRDLGDDTSAMDLYYTGVPGLTVNEIGLYWSGVKIDYATCTGSTATSDGSSPNDFNGQRDADTSWQGYFYTDYTVGQYNDVFINEPSAGNWHFYTITCNTTSGGQVSDSIMINNGGDVTDLMLLQPTLNSLSLPVGATLGGAPFTITNQSPNTATDYTYTFSIDGSEVDTGLISGPLAAGATEVQLANFTYTAPDTIAIVPMEVCMTHADMSAPACANAQINVFQGITECSDSIDNDLDSLTDAADPGCWTDPTDPTTYDAADTSEIDLPPTITATPGIVRQGDSFLLEWDPQGNPGCSLSANAVADGSIAGSLTITAQTQSTYTITCANNQSASVRVQVIPNIFET